jgi:diguanylate cyclase (GGDEF)-like protein/PAS domain S-box-containing protein
LHNNPPKHFQNRLQPLREDVEAGIAETMTTAPVVLAKGKLLYELHVLQIELEMQNEKLRHVQIELEKARDRYLGLYEFSPVGYLTINSDGLMCDINLRAAAMLGVERTKLIQKRFTLFIADHDKQRWHHHFLRIKNDERANEQDIDLQLNYDDGSTFYVQISCLRMKSEDAGQTFRLALTDISKLKADEAELRIAAIVFESPEGMMLTDANRIILRVNLAFTNITGYTAEESVGNTPSLLSSGHHNAAFYAAMWESVRNMGVWQGEIWNRRKTGEIYPEHLTITTVKDANGVVSNYVATFTDIAHIKDDKEAILHLALYDPLTNLPNRRLLLDRLNHTLVSGARLGLGCALLFLDLDNFKNINDTLGHATGDLLLKQVAERLTACVREGDTVSRLGGDEFVVLLQDMSKQSIDPAAQAEIIANKILTLLSQPYQFVTHTYKITTSIGIAISNENEISSEDLLRNADIAMYQAKKSGRNNVCFFDPQMQIAINKRADLEQELHKAIEQQQFQLYYQIQVDNTGHILGAEALIRWLHPERGMILPSYFIPLAEELGLILPIGEWVLDTACAQLREWERNALTRELTISINVSAKQFHQVDFVAQVKAAVQRHSIKPSLLKLELTESMLVDKIEDIMSFMNELKDIDIRFELDDFGTGYSSLQYLKKLPLHQLKIDQSFVRDIAANSQDISIVCTIIAMAKSLSLDVIAEGVETECQKQLLINSGCMNFQGYLFGKPVPIDEFETLLRKN